MAMSAAWFMSLLTPAVIHGSWPSALKLTVTRTWAAESCAETSMAVTVKRAEAHVRDRGIPLFELLAHGLGQGVDGAGAFSARGDDGCVADGERMKAWT